jgi:hypothetical protein
MSLRKLLSFSLPGGMRSTPRYGAPCASRLCCRGTSIPVLARGIIAAHGSIVHSIIGAIRVTSAVSVLRGGSQVSPGSVAVSDNRASGSRGSGFGTSALILQNRSLSRNLAATGSPLAQSGTSVTSRKNSSSLPNPSVRRLPCSPTRGCRSCPYRGPVRPQPR